MLAYIPETTGREELHILLGEASILWPSAQYCVLKSYWGKGSKGEGIKMSITQQKDLPW